MLEHEPYVPKIDPFGLILANRGEIDLYYILRT